MVCIVSMIACCLKHKLYKTLRLGLEGDTEHAVWTLLIPEHWMHVEMHLTTLNIQFIPEH